MPISSDAPRKILFASLALVALIVLLDLAQFSTVPPLMMGPNAAVTIDHTSFNWSGYAALKGTFTSVSGSWTVPHVSSNGRPGADAEWIGIGGVQHSDLIQSGTQDIIYTNGTVSPAAFIEMLPQYSQTIPVTVAAGDSVSVAIAQTGANQWQFSFKNNTNGQTFNSTTTYTSSLSSAEWIVEAPSSRGKLLPLDNFGTVQFSASSTTLNGNAVDILQANGQTGAMINALCRPVATPSALGTDGASFTVTRTTANPLVELESGEQAWRRDGSSIGDRVPFPGGSGRCLSTTRPAGRRLLLRDLGSWLGETE